MSPPCHLTNGVVGRTTPFCLAPPATLTVRGRALTVVCLAITPFVSRPPATLAVRGRFLTCDLPYYCVCVSFNYFSSRFSWLHSLAVQRCGSGFLEAASSNHVLVSETGISLNFPYTSKYLHIRLIRVG